MANEDKPKPDISSGIRALRTLFHSVPNTLLDSQWVIQFCYQCKNCKKVFPLEDGVHTVERERVQAELAEFAKSFKEPRTIECPSCHHEDEYHPGDVGFDILGK